MKKKKMKRKKKEKRRGEKKKKKKENAYQAKELDLVVPESNALFVTNYL